MTLPDMIETDRTVIRPFCIGDADAFVAFMTDRKTTSEFMFSDDQKTEEGARLFLKQVVSSYSTNQPYFFYMISLAGATDIIGVCGISNLPEEGTFECACCISPPSRGQGYATEAIQALISYCFAHYPIEEFKTYISPRNHKSIAIAKRLDMRYLGEGIHPVHGDKSEVYTVLRGVWAAN